MKKVFIYCHGYNSNANTDKVRKMRASGLTVLAWNIDVNPTVSLKKLTDDIDNYLYTNHNNENLELVFVGTSLGGWYAWKLAILYGAKAVLINPSYSPSTTLPAIGCPTHIASKYGDIVLTGRETVFIAEDDEVIDFSNFDTSGAAEVISTEGGGHRYNGPEFDMVLELLNNI